MKPCRGAGGRVCVCSLKHDSLSVINQLFTVPQVFDDAHANCRQLLSIALLFQDGREGSFIIAYVLIDTYSNTVWYFVCV